MFRKDPNLSAYDGGRRPITSVLKNTGPANALIFRLPEEDFNTNSTLIVQPGEEALFINQGRIEQNFTPGTYQLSSKNYPFITKMRNFMSGGVSVFNSWVVFIRTSSSKQIQWGDRFMMRDPVWKIATNIGTGGAYRVKVGDAGLLLTQLLGSSQTGLTSTDLNEYFSSTIKMKIKSCVIKMIRESDLEILGIEENLELFTNCVQIYLAHDLVENGLHLESFAIDRLVIMEDELRQDLERKISLNAGMKEMGPNWAKHVLSEALLNLSSNPGSGGIASTAAGLGLGMSAMPAFSSIISQISSNNSGGIVQGIVGQDDQRVPHGNTENSSSVDHRESKYRKAETSEGDTNLLTTRCPDCKVSNPKEARFCNSCGAEMKTEVVCPSCMKVSPAGSRFCNSCGKPIGPA